MSLMTNMSLLFLIFVVAVGKLDFGQWGGWPVNSRYANELRPCDFIRLPQKSSHFPFTFDLTCKDYFNIINI